MFHITPGNYRVTVVWDKGDDGFRWDQGAVQGAVSGFPSGWRTLSVVAGRVLREILRLLLTASQSHNPRHCCQVSSFSPYCSRSGRGVNVSLCALVNSHFISAIPDALQRLHFVCSFKFMVSEIPVTENVWVFVHYNGCQLTGQKQECLCVCVCVCQCVVSAPTKLLFVRSTCSSHLYVPVLISPFEPCWNFTSRR